MFKVAEFGVDTMFVYFAASPKNMIAVVHYLSTMLAHAVGHLYFFELLLVPEGTSGNVHEHFLLLRP